MRCMVLALPVWLAACASQPTAFSRADGAPQDAAQIQLTLEQCKGEGAQNAPAWEGGSIVGAGIALNVSNERRAEIVKACMARHGYLSR